MPSSTILPPAHDGPRSAPVLDRLLTLLSDPLLSDQAMRATNAPEADPFIKRPEYRKGWEFLKA